MKNKELSKQVKLLKKKFKLIKKSKQDIDVKELDETEKLIYDILKHKEVEENSKLQSQIKHSLEMLIVYRTTLIKFKELNKKWN